VLGINPIEPLSLSTEDLRLVAGNVATAIANARVFEEERKRVETLAELIALKPPSSATSRIPHPSDADVVTARTNINGIRWNHLEKARSQLELVQRNGKRLLKLVNMLLDFRVLKLDVRKPV